MADTAKPPDAIDQAIAAQVPEMLPITGQLSSGRPYGLTVPADLTGDEALSLVGMIPQLYAQLRARTAGPQIAIVRGSLPKN